jgi:hypothetical protein
MPALLEQLDREETRYAQELMTIFERRDRDGSYHFSDGEVRHFLPLLFLTVPTANEVPPAGKYLVAEAAAKAGIKSGASPAQIHKALVRYYKKNPVNGELLKAYVDFVREKIKAGSDLGAANAAFGKLLGADTGRRSALSAAARGKPAGSMNLLEVRYSRKPGKETAARGKAKAEPAKQPGRAKPSAAPKKSAPPTGKRKKR